MRLHTSRYQFTVTLPVQMFTVLRQNKSCNSSDCRITRHGLPNGAQLQPCSVETCYIIDRTAKGSVKRVAGGGPSQLSGNL